MKPITVSGLKIRHADTFAMECTPIGSRDTYEADAELYDVRSDKWSVSIVHLTFGDPFDAVIRVLEYSDATPPVLHRLTSGLRLAMRPWEDGSYFIELSQAVPDHSRKPPWSNLKSASLSRLDHGAGFPLVSRLRSLGANVGPRCEVIGDESNRRNYACAVFEGGDARIPLVAYVGSRIQPLLRL